MNDFYAPKFLPRHAIGFINLLFPEIGEDFIELRLIGNRSGGMRKYKYPKFGFYNDKEILLRTIQAHHANQPVYIGLNPRKNDIRHVHQVNKLVEGDAGKIEHVVSKQWLLIDIDSDRMTNTAATQEELKESLMVALKVQDELSIHNIEPVVGMSGNGWHLLVPTIEYAVDDKRHKSFLQYLASRYDDGKVHVDKSVHDAPRIVKAYGTASVKGANTDERPWRTAKLVKIDWITKKPELFIPKLPARVDVFDIYKDELEEFELDQIAGSIRPYRTVDGKSVRNTDGWFGSYEGDLSTLDICALANSSGLLGKEIAPGKFTVECPWQSEHSMGQPHDKGTIIWEARNGKWANFHCSHSHCADRGIREFLQWFGPEKVDLYCREKWNKKEVIKISNEQKINNKSNTQTEEKKTVSVATETDTDEQSNENRQLETDDGKPIIRLDNTIYAVTELFSHLKKEYDIYEYTGKIVRCSTDGELHIFTPDSFATYICRKYSIKIKKSSGKNASWKLGIPAQQLMRYVLNDQDKIFELRHLESIRYIPYYNSHWDFVCEKKYYKDECVYYAGPHVIPRPFKDDEASMPIFEQSISEFPFKDVEDYERYIAITISQLFINLFPGSHPMLLIDGNGQHLGKSKLAQIISIIRDDTITPVKADRRNETEKRIVGALLNAATCLLFDNMLKTDPSIHELISEIITIPTIKLRILGVSQLLEVHNDIQFIYTSNGDDYVADITSRSTEVNLYREGMNIPKFDIEDPVDFVKEHRIEIIAELAGVVEHWKVSGSPKGEKFQSRFGAWAKTITGIMQTNGYTDFRITNKTNIIDTTQNEIYKLVKLVLYNEYYTSVELVDLCKKNGIFEQAIKNKAEHGAAISIGKLLSRYLGEDFDGVTMIRKERRGRSAAYVFTKDIDTDDIDLLNFDNEKLLLELEMDKKKKKKSSDNFIDECPI